MRAQLKVKHADFKTMMSRGFKVKGRRADGSMGTWRVEELDLVGVLGNIARQEVIIIFESPEFMQTGDDAELQLLGVS